MTSNNVSVLSCDIQINLNIYTGSLEASLLVVWFVPITQTAEVTSESFDQTALKCSLIRDFPCHRCHSD